MLDLTKDYDSYLFGLILTDGNLYFNTRNRGKVQIELSYDDKDIIEKIQKHFYYKSYINTRNRDTNFIKNYKSIIWSCHQQEFREELLKLGIPKNNKSELANVPLVKYNKNAFWRGVIDGDGSIGITKNNEPFISLVIVSEQLAQKYLMFLKDEFNIVKIVNRNKRDNVYNITVKNEDAINLGNYIYKNSTIYMDRKYKKYSEFKKWKRTKKKINAKTWTDEEDNFILNNNVEKSMKTLNRTESSIKTRLWRLKKKIS